MPELDLKEAEKIADQIKAAIELARRARQFTKTSRQTKKEKGKMCWSAQIYGFFLSAMKTAINPNMIATMTPAKIPYSNEELLTTDAAVGVGIPADVDDEATVA